MNKRLLLIIVITLVVLVILVIIWFLWLRVTKEEVTLTTSKTEYQKGEEVKITITNNTSKKIGFEPNFSSEFNTVNLLYRKENENEWTISVDYPGSLLVDVLSPPDPRLLKNWNWNVILGPHKQYSFIWDQKFRTVVDEQRIQAWAGTYRVKVQWYYLKKDKGGTIYSNEFTVKKEITNCEQFKSDIEQKMKQANYCQTKDDCLVFSDLTRTFGCNGLFNKNANLNNIIELMQDYNEDCPIYGECGIPPPYECINNKCVWEMK